MIGVSARVDLASPSDALGEKGLFIEVLGEGGGLSTGVVGGADVPLTVEGSSKLTDLMKVGLSESGIRLNILS